jgi:hypothetical protein
VFNFESILPLFSIAFGLGWIWFVRETMKMQGAGTVSAILYIPVFPVQIGLLITLVVRINSLLHLELPYLIGLSVFAAALGLGGIVVGMRGRFPKKYEKIVFFFLTSGPSVALIVYGLGLLLIQLNNSVHK